MKKVLVLEDEDSIRSFVVINLRRAGFEPVEAVCGMEALDRLREDPEIRVALLDVMLPDIDGFEVCRRIRAEGSSIGIIMLSAKGQEMDKITGLVSGADDYVTKPFSTAELTARIDALYRRTGEEPAPRREDELRQGPFVLNPRTRVLEKDGKRIKLTQIEYALMLLFMKNRGKPLSREELLSQIWGKEYIGEDKVVDVNIRRLRVKLEEDSASPEYLHTIWGYGYQWDT
ncbi:MAG: response regulator transcription factor [Ruminococcaceae bacterium]|nr:response regulator transcription factor [Oscillospiraceae bacterium]